MDRRLDAPSGILDTIPHFRPCVDCTPLSDEMAAAIVNENERRLATLLLSLIFTVCDDECVNLMIYHEPGKVIPPPDKKHCRTYTVPDFLIIHEDEQEMYLVEVGSQPRTASGKLKHGKAAQRRTLKTTDLPVVIIGSTELEWLEQLSVVGSPQVVLQQFFSLAE